MQVKKFEARSMKEALDMIKRELGPEAIILSAKDNGQKYGLVGQGSVEVTAAISESSLQKKQFVENRMPDRLKENFHKSPAKNQKEWVEKLINSYRKEDGSQQAQKKENQKPKNYIDIPDEEANYTSAMPPQVENLKKELDDLKQLVRQLTTQQDSSAVRISSENPLNLPTELLSTFERLKEQGLREEFSLSLIDEAKKDLGDIKFRNKSLLEGWLVSHVLKSTSVGEPHHKLQFFMGPPGSGKTSSMIKWASFLILNRNKKIALVAADHIKMGAIQQIRMYAQILNVPFVAVKNKQDWPYILDSLKEYDYILCDCPGTSLHESEEIINLKSLMPAPGIDYDINFVLSAALQTQDLNRIYSNYRSLRPTFVIFTHLDETKKRGSVFEFSQLHRLAIFAFSLGRKIPNDFELATKEQVADYVLKLSTHGGADVYR